MYGRDIRSAAARYCITGTPDDCPAAVARYAAGGVKQLVLTPLAYGDGVREQVRILASVREKAACREP